MEMEEQDEDEEVGKRGQADIGKEIFRILLWKCSWKHVVK